MVVIREDRPAYEVLALAGFYADDHLYGLGDMLYWDDEPNEELLPLNKIAEEKMKVFLEKLEKEGRAAAEKAGKSFAGRPRTLDGALDLARAVAKADSIMGVKKDPSISRSEKIEDEKPISETGATLAPRKRGRPAKTSLSIQAA